MPGIYKITLAFIKSRCKVNEVTDCWEWQNYICKRGYGFIGMDGGIMNVTRAAYILANGPIGKKKKVYHGPDCNMNHCCNPEHSLCGSQADVVAMAQSKGRITSGVIRSLKYTPIRRARAKLTIEKARDIRLKKSAGIKMQDIADEYGVSRSTIKAIGEKRIWKDDPNIFDILK